MTEQNTEVPEFNKHALSPQQKQELIKVRARLEKLSRLLDDVFTIPVLNIKIGWDAIIGFIPVVGDGIGAILSLYLIGQAAMLKTPPLTLVRMLLNIGIELLLGMVPVLGDFFDITWRANRKNYDLLEDYLEKRLGIEPSAKATTGAGSQSSDREKKNATPLQAVLALVSAIVLIYALVQLKEGNLNMPGIKNPFLAPDSEIIIDE